MLVRRVDGRSIGTFFREEVADPLGADFHIGLPAEHDHRVGELVPPDLLAGGTGNARSVARVHAAMACGGILDGVHLLGPETLDRALRPVISGTDLVLGAPVTFGLGFGLTSELMPLPNDRSMFWGGWGGSLAMIDLDNQMSFAYVMNRMASDLLGDSRGLDLVGAAYGALLTRA